MTEPRPNPRPQNGGVPPVVLLVGGLALVIVVALLLLTGDSGDPEPDDTTTTSSTTSTSIVSLAVVAGPRDFVDALAQRSVDATDRLIAATAADSPARSYARHQSAARAILGAANAGSVRDIGDSRYDVCSGRSAPEQDAVCSTFGDFELDDNGDLTSFSIEGEDLRDRIVADAPAVTLDDISVRVASAYRSPANGSLTIIVQIDNRSEGDAELFGFASAYQPPVGPAAEVTGTWGEGPVRAGERRSILIEITDAPLGGVLTVTGWSEIVEDLEFALAVVDAP